MSGVGSFAWDLLFPPRCLGCGTRLRPGPWKSSPFLCAECAPRWERELSMQCPKCALPYAECRCQPEGMRRAGCHGFLKLVPYGREGVTVSTQLLLSMKRSPRRRLFRFAAGELCEDVKTYLAAAGFQREECVITFLPRLTRTRRQTGVDQARELARALSKETGIPFATLLRRRGGKHPQKSLSAAARAQNLRDAFSLVCEPAARCVLVVDDIVTTGAGMSVATSLLRGKGAREVVAVAVAHTERKKSKA